MGNEDRSIDVLGDRRILGEKGQVNAIKITRQQHRGTNLTCDSLGKIEER